MRISDWSSDVCSSDLHPRRRQPRVGRKDARSSDLRRSVRHERILLCLARNAPARLRSEEHTSELQSLMRISYAVFCLKKKKKKKKKIMNITLKYEKHIKKYNTTQIK